MYTFIKGTFFKMDFLISFVIISFKIAFGLGLNMTSAMFTLQYRDNLSFKFTPNFESMHLFESYKTNRQTFSIVECLSFSFKNSSIKAITYEANNDSTIDCKLYSTSTIKYLDLTITSSPVKLYLSSDITILPPSNKIFKFTY